MNSRPDLAELHEAATRDRHLVKRMTRPKGVVPRGTLIERQELALFERFAGKRRGPIAAHSRTARRPQGRESTFLPAIIPSHRLGSIPSPSSTPARSRLALLDGSRRPHPHPPKARRVYLDTHRSPE